MVNFSRDRYGARFIQQKLGSATAVEKQLIFGEIVPHSALLLIQDVFGNYVRPSDLAMYYWFKLTVLPSTQVIQKLFEHGTPLQKTLLISAMKGHIASLSLHMHGCRVVQTVNRPQFTNWPFRLIRTVGYFVLGNKMDYARTAEYHRQRVARERDQMYQERKRQPCRWC